MPHTEKTPATMGVPATRPAVPPQPTFRQRAEAGFARARVEARFTARRARERVSGFVAERRSAQQRAAVRQRFKAPTPQEARLRVSHKAAVRLERRNRLAAFGRRTRAGFHESGEAIRARLRAREVRKVAKGIKREQRIEAAAEAQERRARLAEAKTARVRASADAAIARRARAEARERRLESVSRTFVPGVRPRNIAGAAFDTRRTTGTRKPRDPGQVFDDFGERKKPRRKAGVKAKPIGAADFLGGASGRDLKGFLASPTPKRRPR